MQTDRHADRQVDTDTDADTHKHRQTQTHTNTDTDSDTQTIHVILFSLTSSESVLGLKLPIIIARRFTTNLTSSSPYDTCFTTW